MSPAWYYYADNLHKQMSLKDRILARIFALGLAVPAAFGVFVMVANPPGDWWMPVWASLSFVFIATVICFVVSEIIDNLKKEKLK